MKAKRVHLEHGADGFINVTYTKRDVTMHRRYGDTSGGSVRPQFMQRARAYAAVIRSPVHEVD